MCIRDRFCSGGRSFFRPREPPTKKKAPRENKTRRGRSPSGSTPRAGRSPDERRNATYATSRCDPDTQFGFRHFVSHLTFATCWYSRASRVDTPCVAPPAGFAALVVPTSASPPGCHAPRRARRFRIARRRASSRGTDAACVPLGTRPIGSPDPRRFESASVARRP